MGDLIEREDLRDGTRVFDDRQHAGRVLAEMLAAYRDSNALVMAVPVGGLPVATEVARILSMDLEVAVVSKINYRGNPAAGYGAIAFDGTVQLNEPLVARLGYSERDIHKDIQRTNRTVQQRMTLLGSNRDNFEPTDRTVILVDDGVFSGITLRVAADAARAGGAKKIIVAVPTGPRAALDDLASRVDVLYCANVRRGRPFAMADAYKEWTDLVDEELSALLPAKCVPG